MSMHDCDNIPPGMVVPAECRPVRVPAGTTSSVLPARLRSALDQGTSVAWGLAAYGVHSDVDSGALTGRIQAGIDASPEGATVVFPPGVFNVDRPVILRPGRTYAGSGTAFSAEGSTIRQADGVNIVGANGVTGVLVPDVWADSTGFGGEPVQVWNLRIDGNRDNNPTSDACGLVLMNYWSLVADCYIHDTPLDGIHLTDTADDGTVIVNSNAENRIYRCRIARTSRDGVHQISANDQSSQDGFLSDCLISEVDGSCVRMQRAAGWLIQGNHLYQVGKHGIHLERCWSTSVIANQIEVFGDDAADSEFLAGISLTLLDGNASRVVGNFVGCTEPNDQAGGYQYISLTAGSGQPDAHAVIDANAVLGPGAPSGAGIGLALQGDVGGSVLHAHLGTNAITRVTAPTFLGSGVVTYRPDRYEVEHTDIGGDVGSRFAGDAIDSGPTGGSGNDLAGTLTWGTGANPSAGDQVGVTYAVGFTTAPVVQLTALNDATAALGLSVVSNDWGFVVRATNAPDPSQPADTYQVAYIVT